MIHQLLHQSSIVEEVTILSREEVISRYEKAMSHSTIPKLKKYKEGYIFNEDMSVKWNREQVQLHNEEYEEEVLTLRREHTSLIKIADDSALDYLLEYSFTITNRNAISMLLGFAVEEKHSDGYENVISYAEDLIDLIDKMNA